MHTAADLKNIWASDPFLFYSIPEIHKNAYKVSDSEDSSASSSDDLEDLDGRDESALHAILEKSGLRPSGIPHLHKIPVSRPVPQAQQVHPLKKEAPLPPIRESTDGAAPDANDSSHDNNGGNGDRGPMMQRRRSSLTRRNFSCPAEMLKKADIAYSLFHGAKPVVKRRHRLSTEAHTALVAEDVLLSVAAAAVAGVAGNSAGGGKDVGSSASASAPASAAAKNDKKIGWDVSSDSDSDTDTDDDDDDFDDPLRTVLKRMTSVRVTKRDHGESGGSGSRYCEYWKK